MKSFVKELQAKYVVTHKEINRVKVSSSKSIIPFIRSIYPVQIDYKEAMIIVLLDQGNNTLGYSTIGIGGIDSVSVDVRLIFQNALLSNATSIVMVHNHPSGGLRPSKADISLTKQVKEASKIMNINLIDHIIITTDSYFSFADNGVVI